MKKKFMAVFALVLAVALTSYSVSGTYAKYTSTIESSDSARVAKWGIGKQMTVDLFSDSYDSDAVKSSEKVIAPGTKGVYTFAIKDAGAPEVAYKLDVAIDGDESKDESEKLQFWTGDATTYDQAIEQGGKQYANFEALKANFGTDLSIAQVLPTDSLSEKLGTIKLHWEWKFDSEDDPGDTEKGNEAAEGTEKKAVIKVKVTATQLDTVS